MMFCVREAEWSETIPARPVERFWPFTSSSMSVCDTIYDDKSELFHKPHQHSNWELPRMSPKDFFYSLNEHKIWGFAFDFSILHVNGVAWSRARGSDEYGCGAAGFVSAEVPGEIKQGSSKVLILCLSSWWKMFDNLFLRFLFALLSSF